MTDTALRIAVVGAGPAGLALALHAAQLLPRAAITLYDARAEDKDVSADPRTLALALGSVQLLLLLLYLLLLLAVLLLCATGCCCLLLLLWLCCLRRW